jgi:hypothetical protein
VIEKDYFTFDELLNRWKCDADDVHYLIANRELAPSIVWNDCAVNLQWEPSDDPDHSRSVLMAVYESGHYSTTYLNGWVYLRLPTHTGPRNYVFSHATTISHPSVSEFDEGTWFRLTYGHNTDAVPQIDAGYIQRNAVFMKEIVDDCETVFQPRLKTNCQSEQVVGLTRESRASNEGGERRWPWGSHETELLRKLAAAAERFWRLYDPSDISTAPTNQQVSDWLRTQGVSDRIAESMATILRLDGLPTGPRK